MSRKQKCGPDERQLVDGRGEAVYIGENTRNGLIAAILWHVTGDAQLSIAICPEGALRARGCQLLARLLRLTHGGRP